LLKSEATAQRCLGKKSSVKTKDYRTGHAKPDSGGEEVQPCSLYGVMGEGKWGNVTDLHWVGTDRQGRRI